MKWNGEHYIMLGWEIMLFELWKYGQEAGKGASAYIELLRVFEKKNF